jgi:hypothetical protein
MKILSNTNDLTISMNMEQDFKTDLGWEEGALQMEEQILSEIINPIENYETVRYIHKPYTSSLGVEQTDIWFSFYFLNGSTYVNDYEPTGLSNKENALMLKQTVKSFFRLEFFKTPNSVKPDRTNRKLVFAKNLSLPLGEKYFHTTLNDYIFLPVFMGSNYRNKENMYLFWFQDESPFSGTTITGNTFWMTAKFYNAEDGSISDFVNKPNLTDIVYDGRIGKSGNPIKFYEKNSVSGYTEYEDLYYKVTIDKSDYSYMVERDVQNDITPTPTKTPTPTPTKTITPTPTPISVTPTPTPNGPTPTPTLTLTITPTVYTYFKLRPCDYQGYSGYTNGDYDVWSTGYVNGSTFSSGNRVEGSTDYFYVVVGSTTTDPGGTKYSVTSTGLTGCPESAPEIVYRTAKVFAWSTSSGPTLSDIKTAVCGKYPYQLPEGYSALSQNGSTSLYVSDPSITSVTPSTLYTLYDANIGGSVVNGGNKYYAILIFGGGSVFQYVAYITTDGEIQDWSPCSSS